MSNRAYSISGNDTNTAATTQLNLVSTAAIQPKIAQIIVSSNAAPADNQGQYQLKRFTAAGTSTAVTPQALGINDPAATATGGVNNTVEPTYTASAILLQYSVNQRATFNWQPSPGFEILLPSTAANGVGWFTAGVNSAFTIDVTILFQE